MSECIISDKKLRGIYMRGLHDGQDDAFDPAHDSLLERDAERIIRCRDCKHRECDEPRADGTCQCVILAHGNEATLWVRPDDYCAWAEPKEEA